MPVVGGKGNRTRKTLSFFGVNFDLNPPYEVLCDGPIIFQSLKNDLYLKQSLPKLLAAPAYPVVTQCVVRELRNLGEDFTNAALFARRAKRVPCVHDGKVDVAECLLSCLRNPSNTGSLLATNDAEVSKKATRIPGVAIVSIFNQKKLILQAPSLATMNYVKRSQKTKIHSLSDSDKALVQEVKAAEASQRQGRAARKKRKRAKGPNPLSIKKSKDVGRGNVDGPHGPSALQKRSPPGNGSQAEKADEATVEFEACERFLNTTPHEGTGSPDEASVGTKRKRKRRRLTEPSAENGLGSRDAVQGNEKSGLSQCADQSSAPGPGSTRQQSSQLEKRENVVGVAVADETSPTMGGVASGQSNQERLPPTAEKADIGVHRGIQQLSSATMTHEEAPRKNGDVSALKDAHLEQKLCQEKQSKKVLFNESMSNTNGDKNANVRLVNQPPLASGGEGESSNDLGGTQDELADMDDDKSFAMQRTADEEDKSSNATPSGKGTKRHRKNRRRRPNKKASTTDTERISV